MKKNEITRFVSHEFRNMAFERMLQDMSAKAKVSPELVRKYTQQAMKEWENETGKDVLTLFATTPTKRYWEIKRMCAHVKDHLRSIVFSHKKLNEVIHIATDSLESMYQIY